MPTQTGIIKLTGTSRGFSLYHHQHYGYLLRRKGGPSPRAFRHSPRFRASRECATEFGRAARVAKLIRDSFRPVLSPDGSLPMGAWIKAIYAILRSDPHHPRGQRRFEQGRVEALRGFELNPTSPFTSYFVPNFKVSYEAPSAQLSLGIPAFIPKLSIQAPSQATEARLEFLVSWLDFQQEKFHTRVQRLPDIPLTSPEALPATWLEFKLAAQVLFVLASLSFYQSLSGQLHKLEGVQSNSLQIIHAQKL